MNASNRGVEDAKLDRLFQAYQRACRAPEPGADFMPRLWQRIESRQRYSFFFGRLAGGFVSVAVALCLAMAVYLYLPKPQQSDFYTHSYVEALAADQTALVTDGFELLEPVQYEFNPGK
jgi:hypothetical protein